MTNNINEIYDQIAELQKQAKVIETQQAAAEMAVKAQRWAQIGALIEGIVGEVDVAKLNDFLAQRKDDVKQICVAADDAEEIVVEVLPTPEEEAKDAEKEQLAAEREAFKQEKEAFARYVAAEEATMAGKMEKILQREEELTKKEREEPVAAVEEDAASTKPAEESEAKAGSESQPETEDDAILSVDGFYNLTKTEVFAEIEAVINDGKVGPKEVAELRQLQAGYEGYLKDQFADGTLRESDGRRSMDAYLMKLDGIGVEVEAEMKDAGLEK